MSSIAKVLRFELGKIRRLIIFWIIFAIALALVLSVPAASHYNKEIYEPRTFNRESVIESYRGRVERIDKMFEEHGDEIFGEMRESLEDERAHCMFFIETNTVESDYINEHVSPLEKGMEHSLFMLEFMPAAQLFLWIIAIIAAAYLFVFEHHADMYKNLIAGQVSRKQIFLGKFILLFSFLTFVFLIFVIYGVSFGALQPTNKMVTLADGKYISISAFTAYAAQCVSAFTLAAFLSSITIFFGMLIRNSAVACISAAILYGVAILMYATCTDMMITYPSYLREFPFRYIPFFSLQLHVGTFDTVFIVSVVLHLVATALFFFFATRKFFKQDI